MVNFRRHLRKLTEEHVIEVLDEARRRGVGWTLGGTVAKAYRQRATTAAVAAVKVGEMYFVRFGCPDAHRNASDVTWFGPRSRREFDIRQWHNEVLRGNTKLKDWISVTRREVLTMLRARSAEARAQRIALIESIPDTIISTYHSDRAGNCPQETERVAKAFNYKPTSSRVVAEKFPELALYIKRAAEYALLDEGHDHTCQQCGKLVKRDCHCVRGPNTNEWCSARCYQAFQL